MTVAGVVLAVTFGRVESTTAAPQRSTWTVNDFSGTYVGHWLGSGPTDLHTAGIIKITTYPPVTVNGAEQASFLIELFNFNGSVEPQFYCTVPIRTDGLMWPGTCGAETFTGILSDRGNRVDFTFYNHNGFTSTGVANLQ